MSYKSKSQKKYDFSSSDEDKHQKHSTKQDGSSSSRSSTRTLSDNTHQQKSSNRSGRQSRMHRFSSSSHSSSRSSSREKRPVSRKSGNVAKVSSSSIASVNKSRRTPTNRHRSFSSSDSSSSRNNSNRRKFLVKSEDEDDERYSSMPIRVIVGEKPPIDTSTLTRNKNRGLRSPSLEKPDSERFNRASNRFEGNDLHLSLYSNSTNEMTDVSPLNTPPPQVPSKNKSKKVSVNPILDMSVLMKAIEKDATYSVTSSGKNKSHDSENKMRKDLMLNKSSKNKQQSSMCDKPVQRLTSAALNRIKEQQRIEKENQMILKRLLEIKPTKCLERSEQLKEYNKIMYHQTGSSYKAPASRASSKAGSAQRSYTSLNYSNSVSSFTPTSATSSSTLNKTSGSRTSSATNYRSSSAKLLHNISAAKDLESLAHILGNTSVGSIRPAWNDKW